MACDRFRRERKARGGGYGRCSGSNSERTVCSQRRRKTDRNRQRQTPRWWENTGPGVQAGPREPTPKPLVSAAALLCLVLVLALAIRNAWWHFIVRKYTRDPLRPLPVHVPVNLPELFPSVAMARAAREFRRHARTRSSELNVPATVDRNHSKFRVLLPGGGGPPCDARIPGAHRPRRFHGPPGRLRAQPHPVHRGERGLYQAMLFRPGPATVPSGKGRSTVFVPCGPGRKVSGAPADRFFPTARAF